MKLLVGILDCIPLTAIDFLTNNFVLLEELGASGYPVSLCGFAPANRTFSRKLGILQLTKRKLFIKVVRVLASPLDVIHKEVEFGILNFLKATCKVLMNQAKCIVKKWRLAPVS